jgi:glycerophosphoryl diester phosphodiesterase
LETVHKFNKKIPLAVLTKANVEEAIAFAKTINAVAIHPDFAVLTPDNVKLAQAKNFIVNTWTVNDDDTIKRMKTYGVNGIISDVPDRL